MITLSIMKVTFQTDCEADQECEAMLTELESKMVRYANIAAYETAKYFGYEVTSQVEN